VALTAEATADGVRLAWTAPDPAAVYNVYREAAGAPPAERPLNGQPIASTEYLDGDVESGARYVYRVRAALADDMPPREGETSAALEVTAEDRFPPSVPTGLVAVQERLGVRLFWNPNPERDLAGYRVFRRVGAGPWLAHGPAIVERPLWLDDAVEVGQAVSYAVSAVDRAEPANESGRSEAVEIEIIEEPVDSGGEGP
jgi:hypothetical protein